MKQIKKQHLKDFGYIPTDAEILTMYTNGDMLLTDKQENEILKYFNL
jgi:hypothetical protein